MNERFWLALDRLVERTPLIIDRPKGSEHPRYPGFTYPLDYGYLDGTTGGDGGGVDVWLGSQARAVSGILCTVDLAKGDAEVKILLGCTGEEMDTAWRASNESSMAGVLINPSCHLTVT